jgi:hypothetical protein
MVEKVSKVKLDNSKPKRKFQVFIWNSKIHNLFIGLLVVCVFLLFGAMKVQGMYINQLEYKLDNGTPRSEAFDYTYDVMLAEKFLEKTGLEHLNIADMLKYFQDNDYVDIYYNVGYIEASMDQCYDKGCFTVTYKFNQNKGLYIDVLSQKLN